MALFPVAGCRFYIGEDPMPEQSADVVEADFTSVVWLEVGKWTQMGPYGDSAQLISTDLIGEGRTKKQKGTKNAGSMANIFAVDATDAGQIKMIEASQSYQNYPCKVELNDTTGLVGATNSTRLFYGLIMQSQEAGGGANTIQTMNATVEINSNIVTVPGLPGTMLLSTGDGRGGGKKEVNGVPGRFAPDITALTRREREEAEEEDEGEDEPQPSATAKPGMPPQVPTPPKPPAPPKA